MRKKNLKKELIKTFNLLENIFMLQVNFFRIYITHELKINSMIKESISKFFFWSKKVIFGVTIILNMKVTVIEIKHYQLKNILIELEPTQKTSLMISKNLYMEYPINNSN